MRLRRWQSSSACADGSQTLIGVCRPYRGLRLTKNNLASSLSDGQSVCDAFELLSYVCRKSRRRRADTPDLSSATKVMGTKQGDVLGRLPTEEQERNPQLGSVLLRRSAAHPFHAGIVGDMLAILQHFAAFNLPAHARIVYVAQAISRQGVRKGWTCPKR